MATTSSFTTWQGKLNYFLRNPQFRSRELVIQKPVEDWKLEVTTLQPSQPVETLPWHPGAPSVARPERQLRRLPGVWKFRSSTNICWGLYKSFSKVFCIIARSSATGGTRAAPTKSSWINSRLKWMGHLSSTRLNMSTAWTGSTTSLASENKGEENEDWWFFSGCQTWCPKCG